MSDQDLSVVLLYRLLSLALYEPSAALGNLLTNQEACSNLEQAAGAVTGAAGAKAVRQMVQAWQSTRRLDLEVEYNRLFVGPATPPCPPYQSVYDVERSAADYGTMVGPTTEAMEKRLRAEGLGVTLDHAELADHAAVELELMWYLLAKAAETEDEADAAPYLQRANELAQQHLAPWMTQFGSCVVKEARHPFYRATGKLLEQFVQGQTSLHAA